MSGKGLVNASITKHQRAIGSRESKKKFKKGTFQNKIYYNFYRF